MKLPGQMPRLPGAPPVQTPERAREAERLAESAQAPDAAPRWRAFVANVARTVALDACSPPDPQHASLIGALRLLNSVARADTSSPIHDSEHASRRARDAFIDALSRGEVTNIDLLCRSAPTHSNHVQLYVDGENGMPALLRAVDEAKDSLHLQYFLLGDDPFTRLLIDRLLAAKERGVDVRVAVSRAGSILDGILGETKRLLATLEDAGIETSFVYARPDHRKLCLIDGKVGFTGGMNMRRSYVERAHDFLVMVRGEAVSELQLDFLLHWMKDNGPIGGDAYALAERYFPVMETEAGGTSVYLTKTLPGTQSEIHAETLERIGNARSSIDVATPYFADTAVLNALIAKARAGLRVRLIVPGENDHYLNQAAARANYAALIAAGVEVYEYPGFNHGKAMVIDAAFTAIGSANQDGLSFHNIYELNLNLDDRAFAAQCTAEIFEKDVALSRRMRPEDVSTKDKIAGTLLRAVERFI